MSEENNYYCLEYKHMRFLRKVMDRLYTQNRMDADCMRDHAQLLQVIVDQAIEIEPEQLMAQTTKEEE